jgi:hypothetical protein
VITLHRTRTRPLRPTRMLAAALGLAAALLATSAAQAEAPAPIADWRFDEAAGTALNTTVNSGTGIAGAGSSWDVAVPGIATDGTGQLVVRNPGTGGSGTRTTFADFGPVLGGEVTSGTVSVYATFSGWDLAGAPAAGPVFRLALIEGSQFNTAELSFAAGAGGMTLGAGVDPWGDGSALAGSIGFAATRNSPLTVRLAVDLDTLSYSLAFDAGAGFFSLGQATVDSQTLGVNSLRLSVAGDFTLGDAAGGSFLGIDRIWVVQGALPPTPPIPEPGTWLLWLTGLGLLAGCWRRGRRQRD